VYWIVVVDIINSFVDPARFPLSVTPNQLNRFLSTIVSDWAQEREEMIG
jgi:hypothetical protein